MALASLGASYPSSGSDTEDEITFNFFRSNEKNGNFAPAEVDLVDFSNGNHIEEIEVTDEVDLVDFSNGNHIEEIEVTDETTDEVDLVDFSNGNHLKEIEVTNETTQTLPSASNFDWIEGRERSQIALSSDGYQFCKNRTSKESISLT